MKDAIKKNILHRLKIIEGQVRGLQKLTEEDTYCVDIISQSAAVKNAISGIENLVLDNHLSTHVVEQIKAGKENQAIKEILAVYKLSKRR
ncbi:MAG: metal-sensing transcriptional repressor [Candidatus Magasanikbacteria bacterium]|nr:metal-sensing transcriptional repressor [Candidatus Magasanikbacteria bacterium]